MAYNTKTQPDKKIPAPMRDTLKALGIHKVINSLMNHMPASVQRWAVRMGARHELVPVDILTERYRDALAHVRHARGSAELGDYLEFGVYQGSSMSCMAAAARKLGLTNLRFIGFDSFEGMPAQAAFEDEQAWKPGEFRSSIEYTMAYLAYKGVDMNRVILVKGWFDDTATEATAMKYKITKASVIMIDCDIYSSTRTALAFCLPMIQDEVILFFDDWQSYQMADKGLGEKKAFEEFLAVNPQFVAQELPHLGYSDTSTAFRVWLRKN